MLLSCYRFRCHYCLPVAVINIIHPIKHNFAQLEITGCFAAVTVAANAAFAPPLVRTNELE